MTPSPLAPATPGDAGAARPPRARLTVSYVVPNLDVSGGIKVVLEHAEELHARGHDVCVVSLSPPAPWRKVDVPVRVVPEISEATLPGSGFVIATWFETVLPAVRAAGPGRVIQFSQGYEGIYPHVAHRKAEIDEAYGQPIPKLLISQHLVEIYEGRFPGPFFVLPQAIRAADYAPCDPERAMPREPATIGIVGPFEGENKGIRHGLRAVARLREAGRELRLQRASQTALLPEESAIAKADLYVHGASVAEMADWYRRVDVLVHPSFEAEGFPLPPLEAMAAGAPVVLTSIPSFDPLPDDVVVRVTPGDAEAIAGAVARLLDDPVEWAGRRRKGLTLAREYSVVRAVDALEEALQKISWSQKR
jgi:glycosyltransferase involved in cell wall biosynthesis